MKRYHQGFDYAFTIARIDRLYRIHALPYFGPMNAIRLAVGIMILYSGSAALFAFPAMGLDLQIGSADLRWLAPALLIPATLAIDSLRWWVVDARNPLGHILTAVSYLDKRQLDSVPALEVMGYEVVDDKIRLRGYDLWAHLRSTSRS
jgi:hypothetical protein